nr:MAG: fusion protein [Jingmen bat jeilongvirus 7]
MKYFILFSLLYPMLMDNSAYSQISFTELSKVGIIKGKNYQLKIKGTPIVQSMVVKLKPNLSNITNCTESIVEDYEQLLNRILKPISDALDHMKSAVNKKETNHRFWGAIIGGVALGVATSAQITAGVALHNSIQNAAAIQQLKNAMLASNKAITQLTDANSKTVIALSALQEQINNQIIPLLDSQGCNAVKTSLGLKLNQYFSEISLVFGPNLRDPASETLSIQAISKAFNNDFESILKTLGYTDADLLDVLESDSIRARIISVDLEDYLIIIQIEYPVITQVPGAVIQTFNMISFNNDGTEWMPIFPENLLVRQGYVSGIDVSSCSRTTTSFICSKDTSTPISPALYSCVTGNLSSCIATRNINSDVNRFALSDGVLFVNCMPINCYCETNGQSIIQEREVSNIMISSEICSEVYLDQMFITVGKKVLNRTYYSTDYQIGSQISIDPIDIGTDISAIHASLNLTQTYVDQSNKILSNISPAVINGSAFLWVWILISLLIAWLIASCIWLTCLTKRLSEYQTHSALTINNHTLSDLITDTLK